MKLRILREFEALVFRYGIKSISMDDIAKQLGISKKTIYHYYKDKDEIIHKLMDKNLKERKKEMDKIIKESNNAIDEVFNSIKLMGALFRKINPRVFYDLQKYHPKTWTLCISFREGYMQKVLERTMANGIKQGLFREDINIPVLSRMRMQQLEIIFNPYAFPPDKFSFAEVQLVILEHFIFGICTLRGHKLINKYK